MDSTQVAAQALQQYGEFLETYRHHLELFSKLRALFFAVVGTAAGVIFAEKTKRAARLSLEVLIVGISLVMMIGSVLAFRFGLQLERAVGQLESVLALPVRLPFEGPKYMLVLSGVAAAVVFVGFLVLLRRESRTERK